jgi:flagellar hook-length control protein FliK
MVASSSMDADDLLLRRQEFSDDKRLVNNLESTLADRKTALPTRPVGAESVINVADNSSKLLGETSFGKKLESTMDATQQLLQKVAASERISESSSVSRSELTAASSLNGSSTQSILQPAPAQKAVTEGHTLMMPNQMRMSSPAWNNALGDRAVWIAAQSNRVAEIKLDPPELGSLNVRIQINQDQVNLSFTSPHAHVRDAVEQSLPRLREMFAEQGLQLQDSSVSDQSQEERRERFAESGGESGGYSAEGGADTESVDAQEKKSIGLVDAFA